MLMSSLPQYGFINTCLKSLVIEKFGEETWEKLKTQAEVQDTFMTYTVYNDVITLKLIQEACKILGIIESVARDFFNSEVTMEILTQSEEKERTGKKEHVIFLVLQKAKRPKRKTKKTTNPESGDSHRDKEKALAVAFQKMENYSALLCCPEKKPHWDIVRSVVKFGKGNLSHTFDPVYPERLWVEERTFCNAFPFHIVFDEELRIKQAGVNIQKFVPRLWRPGSRVDKYFTVVHPQVTFTIFSIRKFINSQFVLRAHREMVPDSWRNQPMLKLRGQMIWMEAIQCMMYLCSPKLRSLEELEEQKMHISDIAQHDTTRDLILLNQRDRAVTSWRERKKEELRILSKNLEAERKKTETLLYAMLPKHVANLLKEGENVEAGEFNSCTVLFSDIVTFTNICSACEPIQIVNMLNSMYSKFDRLTSVHNVYKVETIGDAYMVVGGVPVPIASHAKRVANFALGMRTAAREVMNPITGEPIQIRIGIHTGPVLAGVVGEKMPRYCLFGDTVNTASQMESHGLPNKIHLSPTAFRALQNQGFEIVERGEIEVKGKGKMTTYILRQNLYATENEIMGRAEKQHSSHTDQTEADDLGNLASKTIAVMKHADSQQLLTSSSLAYGEYIKDLFQHTPTTLFHIRRGKDDPEQSAVISPLLTMVINDLNHVHTGDFSLL
ncbi:LOW QUALITY PROTEIN: guanylate cyclase soluble subunit beta-2-like [Pangshura tecta]